MLSALVLVSGTNIAVRGPLRVVLLKSSRQCSLYYLLVLTYWHWHETTQAAESRDKTKGRVCLTCSRDGSRPVPRPEGCAPSPRAPGLWSGLVRVLVRVRDWDRVRVRPNPNPNPNPNPHPNSNPNPNPNLQLLAAPSQLLALPLYLVRVRVRVRVRVGVGVGVGKWLGLGLGFEG